VLVIVVAALVIGLAAGYLITFVSYQAQLKTLQDAAVADRAQISELTAIIAGLHPSTSPTPLPTATPVPSASPSPTSTTTYPVVLEVFDANAGQDGNYYYVNFTVRNSGQTNCTLRYVYLNTVSNQVLSGVSALFVDGHGRAANAVLNVNLNPGDSVTIMEEGTAGDLSGTIWQPGMSVSIAVDTMSSSAIFTSGSYVSFPG